MASRNRKHLDDEQFELPEPAGESRVVKCRQARRVRATVETHPRSFGDDASDDQHVCRVTDIRGGNILEIEYADGKSTLCMIPAKYRKKIWIRKGFAKRRRRQRSL